jgi:uncharacterized protein YndB with AHSA1/START domain
VPEVTRERTVRATRDAVWQLVSDPFAFPRWWPHVVRVEDASPDAWTKVLRTERGRTVRADYTLVDSDPPRRITWRQELEESPFERIFSSAVTGIDIAEDTGGGTRVALTSSEKLRGRYKLGGFVVRRAARRRLDDALTGIERAVGAA